MCLGVDDDHLRTQCAHNCGFKHRSHARERQRTDATTRPAEAPAADATDFQYSDFADSAAFDTTQLSPEQLQAVERELKEIRALLSLS